MHCILLNLCVRAVLLCLAVAATALDIFIRNTVDTCLVFFCIFLRITFLFLLLFGIKNLFRLCHFTKLIFCGDPRDSQPFSVPQLGFVVTQNRLLCWNGLCHQLPHFLLIVCVSCLDEAVQISHPLLWELCRPKCHS